MPGQGVERDRALREAFAPDSDGCIPHRPDLSPEDVWTLLRAGCNTIEIAGYAQVSKTVARAMCAEAMREAHRQ